MKTKKGEIANKSSLLKRKETGKNHMKEKHIRVDNSPPRASCACGKTVQERNYAKHCLSEHHTTFVETHQLGEEYELPINLESFLASYLRATDLCKNRTLIRTIIQRYENIDPYTQCKLGIENITGIPSNFHIEHIHEVQVLVCAVKHTPELRPRIDYMHALSPLRRIINGELNLAITDARINISKGQAVKYFLTRYGTEAEIPLLPALFQTVNGTEKTTARFARNIIDLIESRSNITNRFCPPSIIEDVTV